MFHGASRPETETSAQEIDTSAATIDQGDAHYQAENIGQNDRSPIAPNENPEAQAIRRPWLTNPERRARRRSRRPIVKLWRWLKASIGREPSAEELAMKAENEERKRLDKTHREGARFAAHIIIRELTRLGFRHEERERDDRRRIDKVRFDLIKYSPMAYYYHVGHLPWNVDTIEMTSEKTCTNLARAVGHNVRAYSQPSFGLIYMVEVGSTMGIPDLVSFGEMMEAMPKNLPDLAFPVGVTSNGRKVYDSFEERVHLLVAGKTGGGKSNEVNALICSLLMRNKPEIVQMVLIDLKGGLEFDGYAGIPHLIQIDGVEEEIIQSPAEAIVALKWIIKEGKRRIRLLKKNGKRKIGDYNRGRKKGNRLPRMVVIIDEYASLKLSPEGTEGENLLTLSANLFRAAGIHFLIATQSPKATVISTTITNNFDTRMAFSMTQHSSQTVLGSWDAFNLAPVGRMFYQTSGQGNQVQAPYITDATIRSVVAMAKGESKEVVITALDIDEVLTWALKNANGRLSRDELFAQFKDHITKAELNDMLQAAEGEVHVVSETPYRIEPGAGRRPRQMVKAKNA